jgi:hypothetical protein
MRFQQINTDVALSRLTTSLVQAPGTETIVVANNGWQSLTASDNQQFVQLKFTKGHIADYFGVDIYRRSNFPLFGGYTEYAGIGRWEKCATVTDATHAPDADGVVTVNMRNPTATGEFNQYYQVTATDLVFLGDPFNSQNLARTTNEAVRTSRGLQYLCVVRTGAAGVNENTRVTLLPSINQVNAQYFTPLINSDTTGTFIRNISEFTGLTKLRSLRVQECEFTATISGSTMTVSAVASGAIQVGTLVRNATNTLKIQSGTNRPLPVFVTALGTGTGGVGTYTLGTTVTLGTATTLFGSAGARNTLPNNQTVRQGQFFSNAFNGSTLYTLPPTTPPCI